MNYLLRRAICCAFLIASSLSSPGVLLNLHLGYPLITYQNISTSALKYNSTNNLFSIDASPTAIQFSPSESPVLVSGIKSMAVRVLIDNSGNLASGIPGDDFILKGTVVHGATTYSGTLLTGEIIQFGFLDSGSTDQYEFRVMPTGGLLMDYFSCGSEGIQVTSESSTFANSFGTSFNGRSKGNVGLVDSLAPSVTCPYGETAGTNVVECHGHANGMPGAYVSYPAPVVSDKCDPNPTVVFDPPSGSFFALPEDQESADYIVTEIVYDAAGNTNSCYFVIHVQDTLPPIFSDPSNPIIDSCDMTNHIILTNDPGRCYATFNFMKPVAFDNCCPSNITAQANAIDENGAVITLIDLGNGLLQGQFPVTSHGFPAHWDPKLRIPRGQVVAAASIVSPKY